MSEELSESAITLSEKQSKTSSGLTSSIEIEEEEEEKRATRQSTSGFVKINQGGDTVVNSESDINNFENEDLSNPDYRFPVYKNKPASLYLDLTAIKKVKMGIVENVTERRQTKM